MLSLSQDIGALSWKGIAAVLEIETIFCDTWDVCINLYISFPQTGDDRAILGMLPVPEHSVRADNLVGGFDGVMAVAYSCMFIFIADFNDSI